MAINDLLDDAMSVPALLFSFPLVAVVVYWLLVMVGGAVSEGLDGEDVDAAGDGRSADDDRPGSRFLAAAGLDGLPLSIALSVLTVLAWLISLASTVLLDGAAFDLARDPTVLVGACVVSIGLAWLGTVLLAAPIRRILPAQPRPSRLAYVGSVCTVRSPAVGRDCGEAEVARADGSSALIQVRQRGSDELYSGSTALIYDYDADHEVFWITAFDPELGSNI